MSFDLYSLCPCGSGKKLKFCCKDLAPEIEKVQKLAASDQPRAALSHLQHLLAKQPQRASLLDLCALLQINLEDYPAAQQTVEQLRAAAPTAPAGFAYAAILAVHRQEIALAVERVQDALEHIDQMMPHMVLEALGHIGHALLLDGDIIAARAHLTLFAANAPADDKRGLDVLLRLNLEGNLPLLLREQLPLAAPPPGTDGDKQFDAAAELAEGGLWRRAASTFRDLLDASSPQPEVVFNLALLEGWLGRRSAFVAGMRQFANLNVALNDALIAEAVAQLVDRSRQEPSVSTLRIDFTVSDPDELAERFAADRRIERYELDADQTEHADAIRPRHTYLLLDRVPPTSGVDLTCDQAPNVLAFLALYGKLTDREALLEMTSDDNEDFATTLEMLREIGGPPLGEEQAREVARRKSLSEQALSWRWRLPDDTPRLQRSQLLHQRRREAILERWVHAPRAALDGLSPWEAAGKQEFRIPMLGSVLVLEQGAAISDEEDLYQELRQRLRLPLAQPISTDEYPVDRLPLIYVRRYDLASLDDAQLARLLDRAIMVGGGMPALHVAQHIVARDSDPDAVQTAFRQLIRNHPQIDVACQWAAQAVQWAEQRQQSPAQWIFLQLGLSIETHDADGIKTAVKRLQRDHFDEPEVAAATYRILYEAGLIPDEQPRKTSEPPSDVFEPRSPNDSKLWTPATERRRAATGEKSALWTP